MNKIEKNFFENLCKYCIKNFIISNSGPIISSLIYNICKLNDMDAMAVEGVINIKINDSYSRSFAHCFNVYNGTILDASIYQYAITNKQISRKIPMYIVGKIPFNIEYTIINELSIERRFKFSNEFYNKILDEIKNFQDLNLERFDLIDDSKKKNLFFCH